MAAATCADLHPFLDGELEDDRASAFRRHLGVCDRCPTDLEEAILTDEIAGSVLGPARGPRTVEVVGAPSALAAEVANRDDLAIRRSRRHWAAGVVAAGALAAAMLLLFFGRGSGDELAALQATTHRTIEGRLSYPGFDGHRPFRRVRDAGTQQWRSAREQVLAALERRGDQHGLAVALMVEGQLAQAADHLNRASPSAEVLSDQAALAIEQRDGAQALALVDRALAISPTHPPALWNRAVALDLLDRDAEAVQAYEAVARIAEAGWSREAQRRAAALRKRGR
jgi:cellulose synthase operon protein C